MKPSEMNILVVEDDDFQRGMLVKMLQSFGIVSIANAADGMQALEMIRAENGKTLDVVICDLNMPKMDGLELLRHLGQEKHNIGVIITSAMGGKLLASAGTIAKMYGTKLLGAVGKPVLLAQLKTLLSAFEPAEGGLPGAVGTPGFTLDEILHGIRERQFEPYFQAKIDLKSGRLVGAETLARWIHPEQGVIPPYAFIPLLEQSSNLDELTFLMLEKSAAVCHLFQEKNRPLIFSVNLSLATLDDTALADKITHIVKEAGIEPRSIILEITESAAMTDEAQSLENLARLCMNGFQLSIDDYGTGLSSMQMLMRVPFSELKIDQSFIKSMAQSKASGIVVKSCIDMARNLQVKSVAQGVETQQYLDTIKSLGCDIAQGYFISEPLDMRGFYNFAKHWEENSIIISPPPGGSRTAAAPPYNPTKLKVLVVDPEDFSRKMIVNMLNFLGCARVANTDSANAALRLIDSNAYDLIVSDLYLPQVNGLALAQMVRTGKTRARPDTRFMIITAAPKADVIKSASALNLNGFVVKPVTPADMEVKLQKAMTGQFQLKPPADYEAVNVDLSVLEGAIRVAAPNPEPESKIPLKENEHMLPPQRIGPGMILKQDLTLSDGTLLWSDGHVFSRESIKRMIDLKGLFLNDEILVYAPPLPKAEPI